MSVEWRLCLLLRPPLLLSPLFVRGTTSVKALAQALLPITLTEKGTQALSMRLQKDDGNGMQICLVPFSSISGTARLCIPVKVPSAFLGVRLPERARTGLRVFITFKG